MADDANMPSLLSLPLVAGIDVEDPRYLRTREFVLSRDNPYFYRGRLAAGPGSPHASRLRVADRAGGAGIDLARPGRIAAAVARRSLRRPPVASTCMSFHVDDDSRFTRDWFSWADSMFCELALVVSCA